MAVSGFNTPTLRSHTPEHHSTSNVFAGAPFVRDFSGLLFDMDGTIIDSTDAIIKHWEAIGREYGIDPRTILAKSHGRRSIDVFQQIDPERATSSYVQQIEAQVPVKYGEHAVAIKGARKLLDSLDQHRAPWAVVTSGTRPLIEGWLQILNLNKPKYLVTAEDVDNGKPDPACYRLGAKKLGLSHEGQALVLEDAPAGIRAGKAAGFKVLALATTHSIKELKEAEADWIVQDLQSVRLCNFDPESGKVSIEIRNTLV